MPAESGPGGDRKGAFANYALPLGRGDGDAEVLGGNRASAHLTLERTPSLSLPHTIGKRQKESLYG